MIRFLLILILSISFVGSIGHAQVNKTTDLLMIGGFDKKASNLKNTSLLLKRITVFLRQQDSLSKYSFKNIMNAFNLASPSNEQRILVLKALRSYSNMSSFQELTQYVELHSILDAKSLKTNHHFSHDNKKLYSSLKALFDNWVFDNKINNDILKSVINNEKFILDFNKNFFESYHQLHYQNFWLAMYQNIVPQFSSAIEVVITYVNLLNSNLMYKNTTAFYENFISKNLEVFRTNKSALNNGTIFSKISQAYTHLGAYSKATDVLKTIRQEELSEVSKKIIELEVLHVKLKEDPSLEKSKFDEKFYNLDVDFRDYALLSKADAYLAMDKIAECLQTLNLVKNTSDKELSFWRNLILFQCSKNLTSDDQDKLVNVIEQDFVATKNLTEEYDFWRLFVFLTNESVLKSKKATDFLQRLKNKNTNSSHFYLIVEILEDFKKGIKNKQKLDQLGSFIGRQNSVYTELNRLLK